MKNTAGDNKGRRTPLRDPRDASERPLNILLVGPWKPEASTAGVQSSIGTLVEGLLNHHTVTILTSAAEPDTLNVVKNDQLAVYQHRSLLPLQDGRLSLKAALSWLVTMPVRVQSIRRICSRHHIDVIHLYQLQSRHFAISLASLFGGPPMVGTFHGRDAKEYNVRPKIEKWMVRQVCKQTAKFTAVSNDMAEVAEKEIPYVHDMTVVRNGVSPIDRVDIQGENKFTEALPEKFFLSVGRLYPLDGSPVKGHDLAIRAWGELRHIYPDLHLAIMGRAEEAQSYRALADECGCGHLIQILGAHPRSDVLRAMHRASGVIAVSRSEGGGPTMTVLEASALAKPLIVSDIPAYKECLRNGIDSLIVPKENVVAIVEAVKQLLADPGLAQRLGETLAQLSQTRYSAEQCGLRYTEVYRAAMGPRT